MISLSFGRFNLKNVYLTKASHTEVSGAFHGWYLVLRVGLVCRLFLVYLGRLSQTSHPCSVWIVLL